MPNKQIKIPPRKKGSPLIKNPITQGIGGSWMIK